MAKKPEYIQNLRELIKQERACVMKYMAKMKEHQATVETLEKKLAEHLNAERAQEAARHEAAVMEARALLIMGEHLTRHAARRRCSSPCGKLRYRSEQAAIQANRSNGHAMRIYYATDCGAWHACKAESR